MKRLKRLLLSLPILGIFLPVMTCQAKVEQTTGFTLIDMGHGLYIPSSFDVLYEDGTFADLSEVDPTVWHAWENHESYSVTLENGYLAEKEWIPYADGASDGHMRTTVYDQDGNTVFCLESGGTITVTMYDTAGNSMQTNYTHRAPDDDGNTYEGDLWTSAVYPLDRTIYNAQEDVRRDYTAVKGLMRLSAKYEYNTAEGNICHFYDLILDVGPYDMDDDYYETLSYSDQDLAEYMLSAPVYDASTGDYYYDTFPTTVPSQKRVNGVDYYLYRFDAEEISEGKFADVVFYFPKEEYDILVAENIRTYEELEERYPLFYSLCPMVCRRGSGDHLSEKEQAAVDAIISPDVNEDPANSERAENAKGSDNVEESENAEESESTTKETGQETKWYVSEYGRSITQPLTGDVLPINGCVPTKLITNVLNTPYGERLTMTLIDDNYNNLVTVSAFDIEHTNYKYAYLTEINTDASFTLFSVAGSDTPISGNLQYAGQTDVETENGTEQESIYTDPNWNGYN